MITTTNNAKVTKLCIVTSGGTLPILGGINGPILSPSKITITDIVTLLNCGKEVYEVNPWNRSQKVKLTTMNVLSNNFIRKTSSNTITDKSNSTTTKPGIGSSAARSTTITKDNTATKPKKSRAKKITVSDFSA